MFKKKCQHAKRLVAFYSHDQAWLSRALIYPRTLENWLLRWPIISFARWEQSQRMDQRGNALTLQYQVCILSWSPMRPSRSLAWTTWNIWSYLLLHWLYEQQDTMQVWNHVGMNHIHVIKDHHALPAAFPAYEFQAFFWDSDKLAVAENLVSGILLHSYTSTPSIYLYQATTEYTFCLYTRPPTVMKAKINDVFL